MNSPLRVLIVEDSENDARLIQRQLTTAGYEVVFRRVETEAELRTALADDSWQLVLCDYHLPRLNAIRALEIIHASGLDLPVVVVSGQIGEEAAVDLMRRGAHDYLLKDKMARFIPVVQRELQEAEERSRHRQSEFDRSRAERALRESEARYRSVVSALAEGIVLVDRSGLIVACNDSAAHLVGLPKEQLLVSSLDRALWLLYREDGTPIPDADRPLRVCLNTGRPLDDMVMVMQRADGTRRWISAHVRPCLHDASGRPALVAMSFSDITAQRDAEARIREQARLIDLARDAIVAYDLDGTIRFWNQGAERMYGWSAADAVGQNVMKLFAPMFPPEWEKFCQTVIEKNAWEGERRHRNREGREIIVYTRVSLVRDTEQRPPAFLMFGSDITEKKQLEEQFLRAQRLESIGTLSSGVAHDLNNVLSPIMLAIPIVRLRVADPQTLHLLDTIETSASRGAQIVQQILTFTRGLHAQKMAVQTRHLLKEIAEMVQETFPRNIAIEADFPRSLWMVEADTTQLHQVLMNLCVNARDAMMPRGGTLTLRAENIALDEASAAHLAEARPGRYVRWSVIDNGVGIPAEDLPRLFQPFFTTKAPGKGTGLGLSTVANIVRQHNGFLRVASRVGQGTQFDIYLPALDAAEETAPLPKLALPRGHGENVLVVDDEFAVRHICESLLSAYDYRVLTADGGQAALALFRQHLAEIELVVTDLLMPGLSGFEFIRAARNLKPKIKIIAVSGFAGEAGSTTPPPDVIVDAFLPKPFTASRLLELVHEVLAERPPAGGRA
ncbi:MAG TPA: PAS domain S-box protein [Opitutaceae bacterium]|nr:PAS domain S-box protein [Opitutaceae bacterium]